MRPMKHNRLNQAPAIIQCSMCRNRSANRETPVGNCPACQANARVAFHLWLEHAEEEQMKWLRLYQLQLALHRASRWIRSTPRYVSGLCRLL